MENVTSLYESIFYGEKKKKSYISLTWVIGMLSAGMVFLFRPPGITSMSDITVVDILMLV